MIKVGDWVRVVRGYLTNNVGEVLEVDDKTAVVSLGPSKLWASLDHFEIVERRISSDPPASQDWTPHDRYTAAALTGLLARTGPMEKAAWFVTAARLIADEAMTARGES